jgi:hypothetical protein
MMSIFFMNRYSTFLSAAPDAPPIWRAGWASSS